MGRPFGDVEQVGSGNAPVVQVGVGGVVGADVVGVSVGDVEKPVERENVGVGLLLADVLRVGVGVGVGVGAVFWPPWII